MTTVRSLYQMQLKQTFPGSPEFVQYLAKQFVRLHVSKAFVDIFCNALLERHSANLRRVSPETVLRLSVENDLCAIGKMNTAYPGGVFAIGIEALVFLSCLSGKMNTKKRMKITMYKQKREYCKLFYCASAMLAGVEIDPRAQVA